MTKPTLNILVKFVSNDPNNVIITDATNYTALGLDSTKVKINTRIYLPTGTLYVPAYYNTPAVTNDFSPAVPFNYQTKLGASAIPDFLLDSNGCVINGKYKVEIKWYYVDTAEIFDYVFEQDIAYKKIKTTIEQTYDCLVAKFKSTDKTQYGNSTQVSYLHIINYPSETNEPDINTGLLDYEDLRLANGTYVTQIETERIFFYGSVFQIQDTINGKASIKVDCDSMCDVICGINNLNKEFNKVCGVDDATAKELKAKLDSATRLYILMYWNNSCGKTDKSNVFIQQIKDIIGDCNCGCNGEVGDIWVSGIGGSSGGSAFDPTAVYNYINNINNVLTNLINNIQGDITNLQNLVSQLSNKNWLDGLVTSCLVGFPTAGTDTQQYQFIVDLLCQIKDTVFAPPVAKNDFDSITQDTSISKLITLNDFYSSNVTIAITTPPINGVAVLLPNREIKYTPNIGWTGNEIVGYTITDTQGQTSSATWTVSVNPTSSVSCAMVTASCIAEALIQNDGKVQFIVTNTSILSPNILIGENYILDIYDITNTILQSYAFAGSTVADPTVFVTPIPIANNWDNYKVSQQVTTQSSTGSACGTVLYETEKYSLTDINSDIFAGVTAPCLNFLPTDTQKDKMQKLVNKVCNTSDIIALLQSDEYWDIGLPIGTKLSITGQNLSNFNLLGATWGMGIANSKWAKWAICNGNNSTDDERGQTTRGFDITDPKYNDVSVNNTGGIDEVNIQTGNVPPHRHGQIVVLRDENVIPNNWQFGANVEPPIVLITNESDDSGAQDVRTQAINTGNGTDNVNNQDKLKAIPDPINIINKYFTEIKIQKVL